MFTFNSYLLFNVVQTQVPSFEIIELLLGKMSWGGGGDLLTPNKNTYTMERHNGTAKANSLTPFHTTEQPSTYAHTQCVWE